MPHTPLASVHVTPTFSHVPSSSSSVRVAVVESVNNGKDVLVFQGDEIKVTGSASLVGPSIRLVLLPEVAQRFTFILSDGASRAPLGQVRMEREEMLSHHEATQSVQLVRSSGSATAAAGGSSVEALAESLYAEPRMSLSIEAGFGTRLVTRPGEGVRALSAPSALLTSGASASSTESPCDALLSPSGVQWAEWPAFKRQTGSALPSQADADVLEVALAASWLASLNSFIRSSPIVSLHTSPASGGLLLDHTEVVVRNHAPVFRNKILLNPRALAALDPKAEVVLRVYDVEAASVEGAGAVVIPPGAKALVGETAPISVATLLACRDAGERASFLLSNNATPALDKKLQKKGACVILAVGRPGSSKSVTAPLQVSIPPAVSQHGSSSSSIGSSAVASSSKTKTPVVSSSTPFGGGGGASGSAIAVDPDRVVLVDAQGKEHRAPKNATDKAVSISVAASNLPKLHAMSAVAAPLVALWQRAESQEYTLLSHTEAASGADPHFQRVLTASASSSASSDHPEQFRLDVFDLGHGEARVSVAQDRVAFAFLSRGELLALANAADHAEQTVALRSDRGATWERKLAQRGAVLQLSRADTPAEKVAERQAARARAMEAKRLALKQKKDAWVAARSGALPAAAAAAKQPPVVIAASAGAAASPAPLPKSDDAGESAFATPVKSKLAPAGSNLPPLSSSRRGSLTDVEAESIADMEGALLAEKVALARLEAARAALAGLEAKGNNAKAKRDRAAAEAEVEAAQAELAAASERASVAKETLAARRRQRAEMSEAEARARAETDAENASNPNYTPWGMRKRGNSVQHDRLTPSSSRPGSGANSARQSLSLASGSVDNSRADIRDLVLARRMAAAAAAATSSPDALLPARPAGSRSTVFALQVSVRNVKNTGAWNPCVAVYEKAAAAAGAEEAKEQWRYLDHTEKVSGIGETGAGSFTRQMLVEHFPTEDEAQQQQLRFCLYNAGAKDEAVASDLIGSGCVALGSLAALLGSAGSDRAVEVFLYNSGNRALSERLKRQRAAIVLRLAQSVEEGHGDAASRGQRLLLSHAPVPLSMQGGADPDADPNAKTFALAEAEPEAQAQPEAAAPATDADADKPVGSEVAASAEVAPEGATAPAAGQAEEAPAMTITVDAEPAAAAATADASTGAASEKEAEQPAAAADIEAAAPAPAAAPVVAPSESPAGSPSAPGQDQPESTVESAPVAQEAEAPAPAADEQGQAQPEESADAAGEGDADAAEPAAAAVGAAGSSDAPKKKNKKKKKGGK